MDLNETRFAGALARAAAHWKHALIIGREQPAPQLVTIAVRRDSEPRIDREAPNPFRWRRA